MFRLLFISACLTLLAVCTPARAQLVIYVDGSCGDDTRSGLIDSCNSVLGSVKTITRALAIVGNIDGAVIDLRNGPFRERLSLPPRNIHLRGRPGIFRDAIINPTPSVDAAPLISFAPTTARTLTISDLDILQGRSAVSGGGISVTGAGSLALTRVAMSGNRSTDLGGSIYTKGTGNITAQNLTVADTTPTGTYFSHSGTLTVRDSAFVGGQGPTVTTANVSGLWERTRFALGSNYLFVSFNATNRFVDCVFEDTVSAPPATFGRPAAFFAQGSFAEFEDTSFINNNSDALTMYTSGSLKVAGGVFRGNTGQPIYSSRSAVFDRVNIQGPAAFALITVGTQANLTITNSLMQGGSNALDCSSGALHVNHCTFLGQASYPIAPGASVASATITNSIFSSQAMPITDPVGYAIAVQHSITDRPWAGTGNLRISNPRLSALGVPLPGSPAIDRGNPNPAVPAPAAGTVDLAGLPRRVDDPGMGDVVAGSSPAPDVGALEFQGASCPSDIDQSGTVDDIDFVFFAEAYQRFSCVQLAPGCIGDLDFDADVDDADFVTFAAAYDRFTCF